MSDRRMGAARMSEHRPFGVKSRGSDRTGRPGERGAVGPPGVLAVVLWSLWEGCVMAIDEASREDTLRDRAVKRLKKRRDFYGHLLVYFLVNTFLVAIWAATDAHGFFWPIFPLVGWGIGVVMNAWDVFRNEEFDEHQIRREIERLQRRG